MRTAGAAFVDIGELGWSLYLSAHLRWLKKTAAISLAVITSPDRQCLYRDIADITLDVPADFYKNFNGEQSGFGLWPIRLRKYLKLYFKRLFPDGYLIPDYFNFDCNRKFLSNKVIYEPYKYSTKLENGKTILVLPRCRNHATFRSRNLPIEFYEKLINNLCDEFPDCKIKTMGLNSSSYDIGKIKKENYENGIKESADLQRFIDECQIAIAAVGSQSAPPKIALLQGVPTFMIGHEKTRHVQIDNWMNTKAGFFKVDEKAYAYILVKDCISQIIDFIRGSI